MRRTSRLTKAVAIQYIQREPIVRSNTRAVEGVARWRAAGHQTAQAPAPTVLFMGNALRGFSSADHLTPVCLRTEQTPRPRPPAAPNLKALTPGASRIHTPW